MSPERSYLGPYKTTTAKASESQKSKTTTLRVHHASVVNFFAVPAQLRREMVKF